MFWKRMLMSETLINAHRDQKWWSQGSEDDDTAWLDAYHLQEKKKNMYVS